MEGDIDWQAVFSALSDGQTRGDPSGSHAVSFPHVPSHGHGHAGQTDGTDGAAASALPSPPAQVHHAAQQLTAHAALSPQYPSLGDTRSWIAQVLNSSSAAGQSYTEPTPADEPYCTHAPGAGHGYGGGQYSPLGTTAFPPLPLSTPGSAPSQLQTFPTVPPPLQSHARAPSVADALASLVRAQEQAQQTHGAVPHPDPAMSDEEFFSRFSHAYRGEPFSASASPQLSSFGSGTMSAPPSAGPGPSTFGARSATMGALGTASGSDGSPSAWGQPPPPPSLAGLARAHSATDIQRGRDGHRRGSGLGRGKRASTSSNTSATAHWPDTLTQSPEALGSTSRSPASTSRDATPAPADAAADPEDSEDKRMRNTQASARFRAKKKQHVESVQRSIKELEQQHGELAREVDDLRRENGLLKDMVQLKYGKP
ncbi:hypothetical protein Q5752_002973 [Cryptotrichosporon argae]